MRMLIKQLALAGVAVVAMAGTAKADVIITPGNIPGDTQNVLFGAGESCSGAIGPAPTVQGCLNQDRDQLVNLSTTGDNLAIETQGAGQANLVASDGSFNDLTIALAGGLTFNYLIFNIDVVNAGRTDGTATFTAFLDGEPDFTQSFDIDWNGQNFFTVQAINDEAITSFRITSDVELANVNQIRIGGVGEDGGGEIPVPEPGALGLLGLGLAAIGFSRRRRAA